MRYPPQIIDQIKARVGILDEVRKVAPALKKKGKSWWACCPFHSEKSASFHVREDQNSYYCFGCGAAGDVLSFVQETQGGTFTEVVERLARQAGIKLPEMEAPNPQATAQRQNGFKALERASVFFQRSIGDAARAYLAKRALSEATIAEFQLGYSPESWNSLKNALLTEGFSAEILKSAGLIVESEKGREDYDRFRGRLMFPIHDSQARIVGFGGRILDKGEPKYLNSPETPFFNKSYLLYNLHRARASLKTTGQLVLVEGYMDVIALYQAGFKTAVAPLGTSVTEEQLGLLWQNHSSPVVCLDGDTAGRTAAIRAAQKALPVLEPGRTLLFTFLPQGEDPDSLIQKDGIATFRTLLGQTQPLEAVLWQHLTANADLSSADGRAALEAEIASLVATIRHTTVKRHYAQILREMFFQATRANRQSGAEQKAFKLKELKGDQKNWGGTAQNANALMLIALICRWPHILPDVDEALGKITFEPGPLNELQSYLLRAYIHLKLTAEELLQELANGPLSQTVQSLLASSGVAALDDSTDPLSLFHSQYELWQSQKSAQQSKQNLLQKGQWLSEEFWNTFKQLQENPSSSLTPPTRRPI